MRGKLIIIEGGDGSGKATQTAMLVERLAAEGRPVRSVSFPDYDSDSSALVKMYLRGDFGGPTRRGQPLCGFGLLRRRPLRVVPDAVEIVSAGRRHRRRRPLYDEQHAVSDD